MQAHNSASTMSTLNAPCNLKGLEGHTCPQGLRHHPTVQFLEYVQISPDLATRLTRKSNHVAVFANCTTDDTSVQSSGNINGFAEVPIQFPGSDGYSQTNVPSWATIVGELLKLKSICESGKAIPSMGKLIHDTIKVYFPLANRYSNFDVLNDHQIGQLIKTSIPKIVLLAIQLPLLLCTPIPLLNSNESRTIYLTRKLIASLIANAFFCTFPSPDKGQATPDFNFFTLYHADPKYAALSALKREKLKCILNYFDTMITDTSGHHQIVSFERRCVKQKAKWSLSEKLLNAVVISNQGKIEDCKDMLQVDFANKVIGGGVYRESCVMEDIRFCISSELLVSRLFTQNLENDEVVVVTGSEIFSEYIGYGSSFKYKCSANVDFNQTTDNYGRTYTQLVAMDAQYYKPDNKQQQFEQIYLERELHKCYVAFIHGPYFASPVATGNWGCGQFNGDKELKFLIQWMAASIQDRPKIQFHTVGDVAFASGIENLYDFLRHKNVHVRDLYKVICQFHTEYKKYGKGGIFKYIKKRI